MSGFFLLKYLEILLKRNNQGYRFFTIKEMILGEREMRIMLKPVKKNTLPVFVIALVLLFGLGLIFPLAKADHHKKGFDFDTKKGAVNTSSDMDEEGYNKEGEPQYYAKDNLLDLTTFNGWRRYHAACHVCHGPEGRGSSYAPALRESLQFLSWDDFFAVTINGRDSTQGAQVGNVMPAFGDDPNVVGHLEDIYRYLKSMADGALQHPPPKRPKKLEMKDWPQHAKTRFEENRKK